MARFRSSFTEKWVNCKFSFPPHPQNYVFLCFPVKEVFRIESPHFSGVMDFHYLDFYVMSTYVIKLIVIALTFFGSVC